MRALQHFISPFWVSDRICITGGHLFHPHGLHKNSQISHSIIFLLKIPRRWRFYLAQFPLEIAAIENCSTHRKRFLDLYIQMRHTSRRCESMAFPIHESGWKNDVKWGQWRRRNLINGHLELMRHGLKFRTKSSTFGLVEIIKLKEIE